MEEFTMSASGSGVPRTVRQLRGECVGTAHGLTAARGVGWYLVGGRPVGASVAEERRDDRQGHAAIAGGDDSPGTRGGRTKRGQRDWTGLGHARGQSRGG